MNAPLTPSKKAATTPDNNIVLFRRLWKDDELINEQRHRVSRFDGQPGNSFSYNFGWTSLGEQSIGLFKGVQVISTPNKTVVYADYTAEEPEHDDDQLTPPTTTKTIDGITIDTWILDDDDTNAIHEIYAEPGEQLSYAIYLVRERATDHHTPAEWTAEEHPEEFSIEVKRYSHA